MVGVDVGALVALRLAAARPQRVSGIVLVNPPALDDLPGDDVRAVQRGTARFALRVSRGVMGATPLLTPLLEGGVSDAERMPPRLVARYLAPYVGQDGVGHLLSLARALRDEDVDEIALDALKLPVLVVRGAADRWVHDDVAASLAATLPNARLERIEGAGRLVPEEAPEELRRLLVDFAEGRQAAAAGAIGAEPAGG